MPSPSLPPALARPLALVACALLSLVARPCRASPWTPGSSSLEDRWRDGDLDGEDLIALHLGAHTPTASLHGESWVSLFAFTRALASGGSDLGAGLVVGLALDRIATGPVHGVADPPRPLPSALPSPLPAEPSPPSPYAAAPAAVRAATPRVARQCVAAALRASGLGVDDSRLDELVARARASAWLPETRVRAERVWSDALKVTDLVPTDPTTASDSLGSSFLLELRVTWRLDRLLYAGDEPTIERVRLERQAERARVATQALEVLFAWERAGLAVAEAPPGSRARVEAEGRAAQAAATLDVLTAGWFSQRVLGEAP